VPWWERLVIRIVSALESSIWRARDLTSRLKEFIMTRHPKKLPAVDAKPPPSVILSMTCDRPCMTERGLLVQPGTKVTYLGHLGGQAIEVRMEDGSEEVVHPHCFPELR
jgi:hypothetical protein